MSEKNTNVLKQNLKTLIRETMKGGPSMYGIYSNDTLIDTADTEADAKEIAESLNEPDPFALPFEKCRYYVKEM
jgi:hypothetical protein